MTPVIHKDGDLSINRGQSLHDGDDDDVYMCSFGAKLNRVFNITFNSATPNQPTKGETKAGLSHDV